MESTVSGLNKAQISKLLGNCGMDAKEHAKLLERKTQTSREDLANTFTKMLKKSIQNSRR